MDSSGTDLLNKILDQMICGTKSDVEQLTVVELEYITECIDQIENKYLQQLEKLYCRASHMKICSKTKIVKCFLHEKEAIRKAEAKSKIKAYGIRDSFLKQVLDYSDKVMKLYGQIEECENGALKIISDCLKKSSDINPMVLCIENADGTLRDIHAARTTFQVVFKGVYKLGNNLMQRAHIALTGFSVSNSKVLIKLTEDLNHCSNVQ